jgi:hypothetical protein
MRPTLVKNSISTNVSGSYPDWVAEAEQIVQRPIQTTNRIKDIEQRTVRPRCERRRTLER